MTVSITVRYNTRTRVLVVDEEYDDIHNGHNRVADKVASEEGQELLDPAYLFTKDSYQTERGSDEQYGVCDTEDDGSDLLTTG